MAKQAQAQAQRQEAITSQESAQLVSALLRVACYHRELHPARQPAALSLLHCCTCRWVLHQLSLTRLPPRLPRPSTVSYLRGLFPEDTFKAVEMRNLDGEQPARCRRSAAFAMDVLLPPAVFELAGQLQAAGAPPHSPSLLAPCWGRHEHQDADRRHGGIGAPGALAGGR